METEGRCSLCSRDFDRRELRRSKVAGHGNNYLCQPCWSVVCPHAWPADDSAHGGHAGSPLGGSRPDLQTTPHLEDSSPFAKQQQNQTFDAVQPATGSQQPMQRRSYSLANIHHLSGVGASTSVAVPSVPSRHHPAPRYPASMPEQPVLLSGSADDPRWNALAASAHAAGSAPAWRQHSLGHIPPGHPPTFSPQELRNMMDEESLELFESQSHLLDPNSRVALHRQRQYLQWQNSLGEPGPMQSVLERQDSAGSGCDVDDRGYAAAAAGGGGGGGDDGGRAGMPMCNGVEIRHQHENGAETATRNNSQGHARNGSAEGTDDSSGGSAVHELQEARRHLGMVQREREALAMKVQQLEAELEAQRETTLCKMCRQTPRNCVVLPCLHFTACDACFKKHCASTLSCPMCNSRVTGFQTLLVL